VRRYLLDTSPLVGYLRRRPVAVSLVAPWVAAAEAATSIVVYAEAIEHLKGLPNSSDHVAELQTALEEILPYGLN